MEKIERYLDQVCRGIAGPKSLRAHVRQELHEHLLDAVAEHKAAGMSGDDALNRALEDFGGPEQVRSELEATHGHRLMTVVLDKALQWKEKTMKAKWLWTSWAYLAVALTVAIELLFIWAAMIFIVPKFRQFIEEGWLVTDSRDTTGFVTWAVNFLDLVAHIMENGLWLILLFAALWTLFEWRVRSENKPFMRLAVLGTIAVKLMIVVFLTAAALVLPFMIDTPGISEEPPEPIVKHYIADLDASTPALDAAIKTKDWDAIRDYINRAANAASHLAHMGAAAPVMISAQDQTKVDALRTQLRSANQCLQDARNAMLTKDYARLETDMQKFNGIYVQIQAPATQPH